MRGILVWEVSDSWIRVGISPDLWSLFPHRSKNTPCVFERCDNRSRRRKFVNLIQLPMGVLIGSSGRIVDRLRMERPLL
jgi:hypothetical protein